MGLFYQCIRCINCSFNIYAKFMSDQCLVDGDFLSTNNHYNASILSGLPNVQELFQHVYPWNCPVIIKQAAQTRSFYPLSLFGSHPDPLQHFLDLFPFSKCSFLSQFGGRTTFFHCLLSHAPHHALRPHLGAYNNRYVKWIRFNIKKPSFN